MTEIRDSTSLESPSNVNADKLNALVDDLVAQAQRVRISFQVRIVAVYISIYFDPQIILQQEIFRLEEERERFLDEKDEELEVVEEINGEGDGLLSVLSGVYRAAKETKEWTSGELIFGLRLLEQEFDKRRKENPFCVPEDRVIRNEEGQPILKDAIYWAQFARARYVRSVPLFT